MEDKHTLFTTTMGEKETIDKVGSMCPDPVRWQQYRKRYNESLKCDANSVLPYPVQLEFELNGTCNFRCESCTYRMDSNNTKKEEIDYETYCKIIDDGVSKGMGSVRFNYHNEPLLKRDIGQYIKYAKKAGVVDTYLSTNGSLLNVDKSKELIESGLDRLQISIDAAKGETYSLLRPGGDFEIVRQNVQRFIEMRNESGWILPTVRVNFVKQKENINELQEFCDYWLKRGVDSVGIQDCSDWMHEKSDDTYRDLIFKCNMPFNRLVIRYNGDVLPCCMFFSTELKIGNIYESSIEELWNSELIRSLRKLHSTDNGWYKNTVCRRCVKSIIDIN